ncbi:hypothetical protein ACNY9Y_002801 [Cronobacter dublinensis]|nr:hypothetical protein [Cronobacter dublinensis]
MPRIIALLCLLFLAGCVYVPSESHYATAVNEKQRIVSPRVLSFSVLPRYVSDNYWHASYSLTSEFGISEKNVVALRLAFDEAHRQLHVSGLDSAGRVVQEELIALTTDIAPQKEKGQYTITPEGTLITQSRNCTPDMSVACQWWRKEIFLTSTGDLAVTATETSAGMAFLVFPFYGKTRNIALFAPLG